MVSKKSASLLGEYYLEIDPGTPVGLDHGQRREMRKLKTATRSCASSSRLRWATC